MKYVLFVEGRTEKQALRDFLRRWLDPQLPKHVGIRVVRFDGWRDYLNHIKKKVALNLSGDAGVDVIAGIGLLDLYGPTFYPDGVSAVARRYIWGKKHIEEKVKHQKFRQYFAVHETEAWLLSDAGILPSQVAGALPGNLNPEAVNFIEPPSKLLARLYQSKLNTTYKKVTDGANLFQALKPDLAYEKCPYLKQLLDDLLTLARS